MNTAPLDEPWHKIAQRQRILLKLNQSYKAPFDSFHLTKLKKFTIDKFKVPSPNNAINR